MKYFLIISILLVQILTAQTITNKSLFDLYENQKYEELKSQIDKLDKNENSQEIKFLKALFLTNGEEAVKDYLTIFDNAFGELKSIVAKKLSDYYYAKGFYLTAGKYQKYLVETTKTPQIEEARSVKYIIQLGAFGLKENAVQLQEMLVTQNLYTRIEKRNINGNTLHCVWLDGKDGFSETLDYAEKIKEKYHLQYRILQQ